MASEFAQRAHTVGMLLAQRRQPAERKRTRLAEAIHAIKEALLQALVLANLVASILLCNLYCQTRVGRGPYWKARIRHLKTFWPPASSADCRWLVSANDPFSNTSNERPTRGSTGFHLCGTSP